MFLLLCATFSACEDESEQPVIEKISVQFEAAQQTIREDDPEPLTVTLMLSKAAPANGSVDLEFDSDTQTRIQSTPAHTNGQLTLSFIKGATQLQFSVRAINNSVIDGDAVARIRIKSSVNLVTGERDELKLTVYDNDEAPASSIANFAEHVETIRENDAEALVYTIKVSPPVAVDSKIEIRVASLRTTAFVTNPVAEADKILLSAPAGTTELSFTLTPVNDAEITGPTDVTVSIFSVTGSIVKGNQLSHKLTIRDDELANKLRGYETAGNGDSEKRFYEYDSKGRIAKINWETNTGFIRTGTDTYFYDAQDRLVKINKHPGHDVHYLWSNGRIEGMESYQDGVLTEYAAYAYDAHGNVAGVEPYHKQSDGSFKKGLYVVYLYFTDGNVYKAMMFQDIEGEAEPVLISTRTYENYLTDPAPIAMFEVIPTIRSQKNLAGSYRIETNSSDTRWWLTYEFNDNGLPTKRTASSSTNTQTTVYQYY